MFSTIFTNSLLNRHKEMFLGGKAFIIHLVIVIKNIEL